jgi:hypothetical protein
MVYGWLAMSDETKVQLSITLRKETLAIVKAEAEFEDRAVGEQIRRIVESATNTGHALKKPPKGLRAPLRSKRRERDSNAKRSGPSSRRSQHSHLIDSLDGPSARETSALQT